MDGSSSFMSGSSQPFTPRQSPSSEDSGPGYSAATMELRTSEMPERVGNVIYWLAWLRPLCS